MQLFVYFLLTVLSMGIWPTIGELQEPLSELEISNRLSKTQDGILEVLESKSSFKVSLLLI